MFAKIVIYHWFFTIFLKTNPSSGVATPCIPHALTPLSSPPWRTRPPPIIPASSNVESSLLGLNLFNLSFSFRCLFSFPNFLSNEVGPIFRSSLDSRYSFQKNWDQSNWSRDERREQLLLTLVTFLSGCLFWVYIRILSRYVLWTEYSFLRSQASLFP